jgi:hypothetical protein
MADHRLILDKLEAERTERHIMPMKSDLFEEVITNGKLMNAITKIEPIYKESHPQLQCSIAHTAATRATRY